MANQGQTVTCRTIEEVEKAVEDYENVSISKFVQFRRDHSYGKNLSADVLDQKKKIFFEHKPGKSVHIPFTGIPFIFVGRHVMCCHQGYDKNRHFKAERKEEMDGDHCFTKRRQLLQNSKKVGCEAKIYITHIVQFPENKLTEDNEFLRRTVKEDVRSRLSSLAYENLYYVKLPATTEHSGHPVGQQAAGICEPIDKRVVNKVTSLTLDGVRKTTEMKRHIDNFVHKEIFSNGERPDKLRRRYFPTDHDIRNIIQAAKSSTRESKIDQVNLLGKVKNWKENNPEDTFYFRPHTNPVETEEDPIGDFMSLLGNSWWGDLVIVDALGHDVDMKGQLDKVYSIAD